MFELRPYRAHENQLSYNPFREMEEFERRFFGEPFFRSGELAEFKTDIRDEGDHFLLEAELPGYGTPRTRRNPSRASTSASSVPTASTAASSTCPAWTSSTSRRSTTTVFWHSPCLSASSPSRRRNGWRSSKHLSGGNHNRVATALRCLALRFPPEYPLFVENRLGLRHF